MGFFQDVSTCQKSCSSKKSGQCTGNKEGTCKQAELPRLSRTVGKEGTVFHYPTALPELAQTLDSLPEGCSYQLMFGNTGSGEWSGGAVANGACSVYFAFDGA